MLLLCDSFAAAYLSSDYQRVFPKWTDQPGSYAGTVRVSATGGRDGKACLTGGLQADSSYRYWTVVGKALPPVGLTSPLFASGSFFFNSDGSSDAVPVIVMTTTPYVDRLTNVSGKTGVMVTYRASTSELLIETINGGSRSVLAASADNVVTEQDWCRVEMKVDINANAVSVRLNGVEVVSATSGLSHFSGGLRYVAYSVAAASLDDALIYTGVAGDGFSDFLGDIIIDRLLPSAAGTYSGFTPSSGSAPNFTYVDDDPIDLSDYVQTTAAGAKDSYGFEDMGAAASVLGVVVTNHMTSLGGTTRPTGSALAIEGGSEAAATPKRVPAATSQSAVQTAFPTAPSGGAWTSSKVNAAEFGYSVATN